MAPSDSGSSHAPSDTGSVTSGISFVWVCLFGRLYNVRLRARDTLQSFKHQVRSHTGIPPRHQALKLNGNWVTDGTIEALYWLGQRPVCKDGGCPHCREPLNCIDLRVKGVRPLGPRARRLIESDEATERQSVLMIEDALDVFRSTTTERSFVWDDAVDGQRYLTIRRWLRLRQALRY
jgi:hypothetical protein